MLSWMQDLFSNQPPVYARPPPGSIPASPSSPLYRSESPSQPPPRPNPPAQPRIPDVSPGSPDGGGMPPVIPARPRQLVMPGTSSYSGQSYGSGAQEVGSMRSETVPILSDLEFVFSLFLRTGQAQPDPILLHLPQDLPRCKPMVLLNADQAQRPHLDRVHQRLQGDLLLAMTELMIRQLRPLRPRYTDRALESVRLRHTSLSNILHKATSPRS